VNCRIGCQQSSNEHTGSSHILTNRNGAGRQQCAESVFGSTVLDIVQISYSEDMDHLGVLRDKIGRFREEIAGILELNDEFRRAVRNGAVAQVAHGRRHERLQAIQRELVQLADLSRRVVSTEQMKEKHRSRLPVVKDKRAA
jgi:hypothetical protein